MAEKLSVMHVDDNVFVDDHPGTVLTVGYDQAVADTGRSSILYRTQDISQLLDAFINEVRKLLPSDGIEYSEDSLGLYLIDGVPGRHRCDYTIKLGQQLLGNISFTRGHAFKDSELAMFETLVAGLVLPLQKALQYQRAVRYALRDELTGLRNEMAYYDNIDYEIERARRYRLPFSLLLINLDNFRSINREFGDDAGNAILVELAKRLEAESRNSDIVYRRKGDEFLIFLPNTGKPGAIKVANRVRKSALAYKGDAEGADVDLTATIGVVSLSPNDTAYTLMDRADKIINHAKILGKDRVLAEARPDHAFQEET